MRFHVRTSLPAALCVLMLGACGGDDSEPGTITVLPGEAGGSAGASGKASGPGGSGGAGKGGGSSGPGGSGVSGSSGQSGKGGASGGGSAGKGGAGGGGAGIGGAVGGGGAGMSGGSGQAGVGAGGAGGGAGQGGAGGSGGKGGGAGGGGSGSGGKGEEPCTTRITYGSAWIHGDDHPGQSDVVSGDVEWDGNCAHDGANSYAVLSNGWKPYFKGHGCTMALDRSGCAGAPKSCGTRVSYGSGWLKAPNHPATYDDVGGRVVWGGRCEDTGGDSFAALSNGWKPHFSGKNACDLSFRYEQCGGLYTNSVVDQDCPDPGVMRDGDTYVMACTGGDGGGTYVIRTSKDLASWKASGHIFPSGKKPSWAKGDFWAPEIHRVGDHYVAYFSARHQDGRLSVGAAPGPTALGPFVDPGKPLVHDASMGMIDVNEFEDADGNPYLVWKADGNAVGKPTPIYGQKLSPDGLSLVGERVTLISNTLGWEGPLVEAPWVVRHGGSYFLFYSANAYYNGTYAVGVARSTSPLGPYKKAGDPIVKTWGPWVGPGHGSVVSTPAGDSYFVYHAWQSGKVNGPGDGRLTLVDLVVWGDWPSIPAGPSARSQPLP